MVDPFNICVAMCQYECVIKTESLAVEIGLKYILATPW